jgi:diguanylate cyclase (GGDEF)-like protein
MYAAALKDCCREYDYSARMGGDEFVMVAPGLETHAAEEMLKRLESIISQVGRAICGDAVVSVSVGHAFYPADGQGAEQLLAEADRRMYCVKNEHYSAKGIERTVSRAAGAGASR